MDKLQQIEKIQDKLKAGNLDKAQEAEVELMICMFLGKIAKPVSKYLSSRDALMNIRPEEFEFDISVTKGCAYLILDFDFIVFKDEIYAEAYAIMEYYKKDL